MLPVSLDCSCFIALSVVSNIYLSCVLSTLCYQFLWLVHVLLPFWYSLTCICPVSCLPYAASFSELFIFYCPFGILLHLFVLCLVHPMRSVSLDCSCFITLSVFSNIDLSCVLSILCCQFLQIVHVLLPFRYSLTFIRYFYKILKTNNCIMVIWVFRSNFQHARMLKIQLTVNVTRKATMFASPPTLCLPRQQRIVVHNIVIYVSVSTCILPDIFHGKSICNIFQKFTN